MHAVSSHITCRRRARPQKQAHHHIHPPRRQRLLHQQPSEWFPSARLTHGEERSTRWPWALLTVQHHLLTPYRPSRTPKQPYLLIPDPFLRVSAYVYLSTHTQPTWSLLRCSPTAQTHLYGAVIVILHSFTHSAAILLPGPEPPTSTGQHST